MSPSISQRQKLGNGIETTLDQLGYVSEEGKGEGQGEDDNDGGNK